MCCIAIALHVVPCVAWYGVAALWCLVCSGVAKLNIEDLVLNCQNCVVLVALPLKTNLFDAVVCFVFVVVAALYSGALAIVLVN